MSAIYPFPKEILAVVKNMPQGNFGLWYNKYVPLSNNFKAANDSGSDTEVVEYYFKCYDQMKNAATDLLRKKHNDQEDYCAAFPSADYEVITVRAKLISPLVTGIGESHPHEVSMVFDHNMGIPYMPASGVKGIVRFAYTLSIFLNDDGSMKEEYRDKDFIKENVTDIPDIFGGEKGDDEDKELLRGKVVFLDAYPERVPDLKIDIMNPHYGDYYDPKKQTPPADYLPPNPIKFLTVAPGTAFIFRAIARKEDDIPQMVRKALHNALTKEGVGAKTAIGYGHFELAIGEQSASDKHDVSLAAKQNIPLPPIEEVWENAFVSFDPGSGIVRAQSADKKKAEIRPKDKALAATDASLHKKLFEGKKKTLPKARVTVRKVGNAWEIVKIEPQG